MNMKVLGISCTDYCLEMVKQPSGPIFKKENDYVDVNSSYFVFCNDNEFICSFVSDFDPDVAYKADRVKVFLKSNKVVGFSIVDLTSREIRKLKSI